MKSESINELAMALVSAQAEFSAVPKDSVNPFFKSKYAGLPEVVKHTAPILSKHGLAVSQFIDSSGDNDTLTTYLLHTSGQYISHEMRLHLVKNDPQAQGSAVTYARRYSYMSCLGIVADDDDDGNFATQATQQSAPAPKAKVSQPSLSATVASKAASGKMATEGMTRMIWAISHTGLGWDDLQMYDSLDKIVGHPVTGLADLTFDEAKAVIDNLKSLQGTN
jgi:hypothetical protein